MSRLLYLEKGLLINYNNNENVEEKLFELNNNNEIINTNIIFPCNFTYNKNDLKNNIEYININNKFIEIEKGFLFYSYIYEKSFAHYITQTIPKLSDYIQNYYDFPLLIPNFCYNIFSKNLLNLLKIDNIIILEDKFIYNINNLITIPHYHAPPSYFTNNHLFIYNLIRNKLEIKNDQIKNRKIYLKRDSIQNDKYGNSETGICRQILNENELIDKLKNLNFEIITLGTSSIENKKKLLENASIIITPSGANCCNFLFTNAPNNIIYLGNLETFTDEYFSNIIKILNSTNINCHSLRYQSIYELCDPTNKWNSPFNVDIDDLIIFISKLNI